MGRFVKTGCPGKCVFSVNTMKTNQLALEMKEAFRDFVLEPDFPCLGAKAAFNSDSHTVCVFDELGNDETTGALAAGLRDFTALVGRDAVEPRVAKDWRVLFRSA